MKEPLYFGVGIPRGGIAYSPENAEFKAREIGGSKWVVKAQVHSGARGKAGGVILCETELEVAQATDKLLGRKLITNQTLIKSIPHIKKWPFTMIDIIIRLATGCFIFITILFSIYGIIRYTCSKYME